MPTVLIIVLLAVTLAVLWALDPQRRGRGYYFILAGVACSAFGIVTSYLEGREFMDVLLLQDAAGFGRAHFAGVVMVVAGLLIETLTFVGKLKKHK
ncbi:MAG: hypothetical protein AMJ69_10145 [Gammaproteobacteria bacterium SG8_47]|nr:MAG: hypothetical protein AMJ69_10145 [Gammaproteobacteria bacterium SG8_47]